MKRWFVCTSECTSAVYRFAAASKPVLDTLTEADYSFASEF
jgi:hypothetical protein